MINCKVTRKLFTGVILGLLVGGIFFNFLLDLFLSGGYSNSNPIIINAHVPECELTDTEGETYTLSKFEFVPLVINFWATWCAPCKLEMLVLNDIYIHKIGKFEILAINAGETG